MRHLLWLGPVAAFAAVIAYWTTIRPELAETPAASKAASTAPLKRDTPAPDVTTPTRPEVIEPILVLREVEMLPEPVRDGGTISPPNAPLGVAKLDFSTPRPEAGRETRRWMPYAGEDGDLSAQRKLQWARLIIDEGKVMPWAGGTEETSEPPLFAPKR